MYSKSIVCWRVAQVASILQQVRSVAAEWGGGRQLVQIQREIQREIQGDIQIQRTTQNTHFCFEKNQSAYVEMDDPILLKPKKWIIEQKHLNCSYLAKTKNIGKNNTRGLCKDKKITKKLIFFKMLYLVHTNFWGRITRKWLILVNAIYVHWLQSSDIGWFRLLRTEYTKITNTLIFFKIL